MGKFKKDLKEKINEFNIFDILGDFKSIPIEKAIDIFKIQSKEYNNLDKLLNIPQFISNFHSITKSNKHNIDLYNELIQSFVSILNIHVLMKNKEDLLKQQEISQKIHKRGDFSDLIYELKELNDSIIEKKQKMKYFEEDYFKEKNKVRQIKKEIGDCDKKVKNLEKEKKECFSKIDKIMKEMENLQAENTRENHELSYSEKIQALQKKSKEIQYEIKKTSVKLNEFYNEFKEFNIRFEKLESNYQELLSILSNDNIKVKRIKKELGEKIKENLDNFSDLYFLKSAEQINIEIQKIENKINFITKSNQFLNNEQPNNLSKIEEKIISLNNKIYKDQENKTTFNITEIIECIEKFRKLEALIHNLEALINKFLFKIYLRSHFEIRISDDNKNFFFQLDFVQLKKKKILNFNQLTTPEKIFFVIVFYISIKILLNSKDIIISNLFLLPEFNKRGSIFRTIKNIIPVFEREDNLKNFNLIFILSNLEMKEQIKNLKVINI